jgi:hypothetical protein
MRSSAAPSRRCARSLSCSVAALVGPVPGEEADVEPLDGHPVLGHEPGECHRQPCLHPGQAVGHDADVVAVLRLLRRGVAAVIGAKRVDIVDIADDGAGAQRGHRPRRAQRGATHEALRVVASVSALVEGEVVRAGLGVGADAAAAGGADQVDRLRGGLVHEVHRCPDVLGGGEHLRHGGSLGQLGAGERVVPGVSALIRGGEPLCVLDHVVGFGVHVRDAALGVQRAQHLEHGVRLCHDDVLVRREHLDRPDATVGHCRDLLRRGVVPGDHAPVQRGVAPGDGGEIPALLHGIERALPRLRDREVDDRGGAAPERRDTRSCVVIELGVLAEPLPDVTVRVDPARDDELARGVDRPLVRRERQHRVLYRDDPAVRHDDGGRAAAARVDDGAAVDDEVRRLWEGHRWRLQGVRRRRGWRRRWQRG